MNQLYYILHIPTGNIISELFDASIKFPKTSKQLNKLIQKDAVSFWLIHESFEVYQRQYRSLNECKAILNNYMFYNHISQEEDDLGYDDANAKVKAMKISDLQTNYLIIKK